MMGCQTTQSNHLVPMRSTPPAPLPKTVLSATGRCRADSERLGFERVASTRPLRASPQALGYRPFLGCVFTAEFTWVLSLAPFQSTHTNRSPKFGGGFNLG